MRNHIFRIPALALGLLILAGPVAAQDAASELDGRWLPYIGCWVEVANLEGPLTCVLPEDGGVALLTVTDSTVTDRQVVRADGQERPAEVSGCTGAEAAEFSADGQRVYTRSRLDCGGEPRSMRGLIAMVGANQWVEIQAVGPGDDGVAWVKRYRLAPPTRVAATGLGDQLAAAGSQRTVEVARAAASGRIEVEDIIEADARTHSEVVRAWIAEQGEPIRVDARQLVRLADAGVPSDVIDVAVAVSFPDRFAVARTPGQADGQYGRAGYDRFGYVGAWSPWSPWSPFYYDPYYYRYSRYSSFYNYGFYGPGYIGYRPTVVVVAPSTPQARPGGRLIRGQGYTQGSSGGTASRPSMRPGSSSAVVGSGSSKATSSSGSSGSKGKAKRRGSGGGS